MEGNSICSCIREIFEEAQREQVISSQFQDNPYSHLLPFSCLIINGAVMLDNTKRRRTESTVHFSLLIWGLVLLGGR